MYAFQIIFILFFFYKKPPKNKQTNKQTINKKPHQKQNEQTCSTEWHYLVI